jgi:hypothetical protein
MATTSKLSDSTPFGGDDNAALIAELKRQGFKYVTGNFEGHIQTTIYDPIQKPMLEWVTLDDGGQEDESWSEFCNRLKTDPRKLYVQERLNILARVLVRDIYIVERNAPADALIQCERLQQPEWRRAVMLAGKILSLDLGPVHGT